MTVSGLCNRAFWPSVVLGLQTTHLLSSTFAILILSNMTDTFFFLPVRVHTRAEDGCKVHAYNKPAFCHGAICLTRWESLGLNDVISIMHLLEGLPWKYMRSPGSTGGKVEYRGGDGEWEHEGSGWPSWGTDIEGEQWNRYLDKGGNYGVREISDARETPRDPHGWPQQRLLTIVESVPKLTFSCNRLVTTLIVSIKPSSSNW